MTDPLGQSQVIPYLQGLTKLGYEFTLLSCEKPENFRKHNKVVGEVLIQSNIDWQPITYHSSPPILSTLYDIKKILSKAYQLHKLNKYSIVHCRSYISSIIGLSLKRNKGVKFVFDMRGFWADERVDGKLWNLKNPIYKGIYNHFKRKERQYLEEADAVISLTHAAKVEIHSWGVGDDLPNKTHVIPCCVDLGLFDPSKTDKAEMRKRMKIDESAYILLYLGSIGTWYMLDEMLDYFIALKSKKKTAHFLFVTQDDPHDIISKAQEKGLNSSQITITSSTRQEVSSHIAIANLSIFFILPAYSKLASSPTKQAEIMAMNIPVVTNRGVGDVEKILEKEGQGSLVRQFNEENYMNSIHELSLLPSTDTRPYVEANFSLSQGVNRYAGVYQKVLSQ